MLKRGPNIPAPSAAERMMELTKPRRGAAAISMPVTGTDACASELSKLRQYVRNTTPTLLFINGRVIVTSRLRAHNETNVMPNLFSNNHGKIAMMDLFAYRVSTSEHVQYNDEHKRVHTREGH